MNKTNQPSGALQFLRLADILKLRRTSRTGAYRDIADGTFPPPVKLGRNTSAWPEHEIQALDRARLAGASDDQVRELVASLILARRVAA